MDQRRELKRWTDFKQTETHRLRTQIELLRKELDEMNDNYDIIASSIKSSLSNTVEKIKQNTEDFIQKKNKSVAKVSFDVEIRFFFYLSL
jgi:predicted  nucleic acid-binding Zn-ribbon protein